MFEASSFPDHVHEAAKRRPIDVASLSREIFQDRLVRLEEGLARVRIPKIRDRLQIVEHTHFHLLPELFIQVSGYSVFRFPSEVIRLYPGDICVVPRGMPHAETAVARHGPFHNLVVAYTFEDVNVHLSHEVDHGPRVLQGDRFRLSRPRRLWTNLDDAADAFHGRSAFRTSAVKGLLVSHLAALLVVLEGQEPEAQREAHKISQCRQFVQVSLTNPDLSVRLLAEWVQCSPDYLSHLFNKETGIPLKTFINQERVEYARRLLESSALNVAEVALASGYQDPSYFTRVFRKITGQTPKAFRATLRKIRITAGHQETIHHGGF